MTEIFLLLMIIAVLGVWVASLSRKVTQLEYEICTAQLHFEKQFKDVMRIIQEGVVTNNQAYCGLTSLMAKHTAENMKNIAQLQKSFLEYRQLINNIVLDQGRYIKKGE